MKKIFRGIVLMLLAGVLLGLGTPRGFAQAPDLSLKDSIPLAEKALGDAKIKIENYYLFSITYSNSTKGSYWYYTYRPLSASEYNQVYVKVYMDRTVDVRGGNARGY